MNKICRKLAVELATATDRNTLERYPKNHALPVEYFKVTFADVFSQNVKKKVLDKFSLPKAVQDREMQNL